MRAHYDFNPDLDIDLFNEDIELLLRNNILKGETKGKRKLEITIRLDDESLYPLEVKQLALWQLKFKFHTPDFYLEGYFDNPELVDSLGYDITLRKQDFIDYVKNKKEDEHKEFEPFWGRGIQFGAIFDRLHLTYRL